MLTPLDGLADVPTSTLLKVPLDALEPDPRQPRRHFDHDKLQALATNMAAIGQRDPIKAYLIAPGRYRLEDGERRWRAAQLCGWALIDVRVVDRPEQPLPLQVAANELHENLAPGELLDAIAGLAGLGMNQVQISHHVGRSRQFVNQAQRLNRHHPDLVDAVRSSGLSLRAAFTDAGILRATRRSTSTGEPNTPTGELPTSPDPSTDTSSTRTEPQPHATRPPPPAERPEPRRRDARKRPSTRKQASALAGPADSAGRNAVYDQAGPAQAPTAQPQPDSNLRAVLVDAVTTVAALVPELTSIERVWLAAELKQLADALHD